MTSLVTGVGLGIAGYLVAQPGVATTGAFVAAAGLYVERLQARSLRRRRRAERMRSRHEVTELRRTIAQLRVDVGAFQRALLDTEAALAARDLPLLPQPAPIPAAIPTPTAAPASVPASVPAAAPAVAPAPVPVLVEPVAAPVTAPQPEPVVVAEGWVQIQDRDVAEASPLPVQHLSPFVAALSGSIPVVTEAAPVRRRPLDTGGIPVLEPAPRDRLTATTDALVYAALTELDEEEATRDLAYAVRDGESGTQETRSA
jgi:hypothetical protein